MNGVLISESGLKTLNVHSSDTYVSGGQFFTLQIVEGFNSGIRRERLREIVVREIQNRGCQGLANLTIDSDEVLRPYSTGYHPARDTLLYDVRGTLLRKVA